MAGTANTKWQQPCHTDLAGLADAKLQRLRPDDNFGNNCGCDNSSTNGSFDGFSMHSGGVASSEETTSQAGELCVQPVLGPTTLRAALSAVTSSHPDIAKATVHEDP